MRPEERAEQHAQRARLAERAKIGKDWDGSSSDYVAWPLAKALLADGNKDLLKYAMAYRRIYDQAKSEAVLGGKGVSLGDGVALDRYSYVRPDGTVVYKHARQSRAAHVDIPARHYSAPPKAENLDLYSNDPTSQPAAPVKNWSNVPKPWDGDRPVNDMIDAQRELARLQARLGHLCEPFEMACIDGATLAEVGNSVGIANRSGAQGAGRALVHTALITVRDALGSIGRRDLVG